MYQRLTRHVVPAVLSVLFTVASLSSAISADLTRDEQLHRAIGQTIIVGFFGNRSSDPGFRQIIDNLGQGIVGGVLFLGRNISTKADVESMVGEIRQCKCRTVPIIAIDEEGGLIERLGERSGFTHTPSAAEMALTTARQARLQYRLLANKLSAVGFNMNFAPVVDLNTNKANPVIGSLNRSFSESPKAVIRYASIFIEEHRKRGILTTLKHFPGHGSSSEDSHNMVADVRTSWSTRELAPYRFLIDKGLVDSVMVGHLANESRWGGVATQFGSHAIDRMLRRQLKFDGVVLSDDLSMDAISADNVSLAKAASSAVKAGVDLVVVTRVNTEDECADTGSYVHSAIFQAVKSGELQQSAIALSSRRVLLLKTKIGRRR